MEDLHLVNGRYRIRERLGAGGVGDTYVAVHAFTHRRVTLKLVRRFDLERSRGLEGMILREATAVAAVDHPHVVEILDAGREANGDLFLVFEYLVGEDLETTLSEGRLSIRDLLQVTGSLLEALGAVHRSGYVHRDVKPSNVILARHGVYRDWVKLIDFGSAVRMDDRGPAGPEAPLSGTLEYMSPEQAQGVQLDGRSDIWSVGAVLFRALTGRLPIQEADPFRHLIQLTEVGAPLIASVCPGLSDSLSAVVDRALSRLPEDRFSTAPDMAQALALVDLPDEPIARVSSLMINPSWRML